MRTKKPDGGCAVTEENAVGIEEQDAVKADAGTEAVTSLANTGHNAQPAAPAGEGAFDPAGECAKDPAGISGLDPAGECTVTENCERAVTEYADPESESGQDGAAVLEYEDKQSRGQCVKHFKTVRGTYQARYYGTPVHYWNEEEKAYREIDNGFFKKSAADPSDPFDLDGYENKYGAAKVRMAHSLHGGKIASLTKDGHSIMLELNGRKLRNAAGYEKSVSEAEVFLHDGKGHFDKTLTADKDLHLGANTGEIVYKDFVPDADLQFILDGAKLKENIIIKKHAESYEFGFSLLTRNLDAQVSKDGQTVSFFSELTEERGAPVFTIPAAFMTDKAGAYSGAVEYSMIQKTEGNYTLKIVPDSEWIESPEREFPVIIDPTVVFDHGSGLSMAECCDPAVCGPSEQFKASNTEVSIFKESRVYIFADKIIKNAEIINAKFHAFVKHLEYTNGTDCPQIEVRKIKTKNFSSWATKPVTDNEPVADILVSKEILADQTDKPLEVDLGKIYKDSDFAGFEMRFKNQDTVSGVKVIKIGGYPEYNVNPYIQVEYSYNEIQGDKQLSNSLNRAGTGIFDLYSKNLKFVHQDLALDHVSMPVSVSHIYNSAYTNKSGGAADTFCGSGWRTSYHQYIGARGIADWQNKPRYFYVDGSGEENEIVYKDGGYVLAADEQITFYPADMTLISPGGILYFSSNGWINKQADMYGNYVKINQSSPGKILSVQDNFSRTVTFEYNAAGLLSRVHHTLSGSAPAGSQAPTPLIRHNLYFAYSGTALTKISYGSAAAADKTEFGYQNGSLLSITDPSGHKLEYIYGANGAPSAIRETSGNIIGHGVVTPETPQRIREWGITYDDTGAIRRRTVTKDGISVTYGFDSGKCLFAHGGRNAGKEIVIPSYGVSLGAGCPDYAQPNTMVISNWDRSNSQTVIQGISADTVTGGIPIKIIGEEQNKVYAAREFAVPLSTLTNRSYVVSCYARGDGKAFAAGSAESSRFTGFTLKAELLNGASVVDSGEWYYESGDTGWQAGAVCLKGGSGSGTIKVSLIYNYQPSGSVVHFEGLRICEAPFQKITMKSPSVIKTEYSGGEKSEVRLTDKNADWIKKTGADGRDYISTYSYDSAGRMTAEEDYRGTKTEYTYGGYSGMLSKIKRSNNKTTVYTEDGYESKLTSGSNNTLWLSEKPDAATEIITSIDKNELASISANGYTETYDYEYPGGALMQKQKTAYNLKNAYTYTKFMLTQVVSDNNKVQYTYDGFGELKETKFIDTVRSMQKTNESRDTCTYAAGTPESQYNYRKETINAGANGSYSVKTYYDAAGNPCKMTESVSGGAENTLLSVNADSFGRPYRVDDYTNTGVTDSAVYSYNSDSSLKKAEYTGAKAWSIESSEIKNESIMSREITYGGAKVRYTSGISVPPGNPNETATLTIEPASNPAGKKMTVWQICDRLGRPELKLTNITGGELWETAEYEGTGSKTSDRVQSKSYTFKGAGSRIENLTYNTDGSISAITNIRNGAQKYAYDGAGRLTREDNSVLGFTKVYAYHTGSTGGGNIKSVTKYAYNPNAQTASLSGGTATSYAYEANTDRLYNFGNQSISAYDSAGNPCNYKGKVLEWERGRRLKKYGTVSYKYNAGGIRQEKQNGAEKRVYYTEGTTIHREVITGGNTPGTLTYYYDNTGLCAIEQDSLLYYVIKNLQGDIVMILDSNGSIQAQYVYDAWGNHKIYLSSGTLIYDNITGLTSGGYANNIGVQNPFRYRGYYWDQETGLYYLNSRYYDPEVGRFISADDISYLEPETINGLNLYSYCGNNPVMNIDPDGHAWYEFWKWDWNTIGKYTLGAVAAISLIGLAVAGTILSGGTLAPVLIGFGIGAGASLIGQGVGNVLSGKGFFEDISIFSIIMGGLAGAAFATGIGGLLGAIAIGAISSAGTSAFEQKSWANIGLSAVVGGFAAGVGYGVGQLVGRAVFGKSDLLFKDFYQLARLDTNIVRALMSAFRASYYTFIPTLTPGATRGLLKYLGNKGINFV